MIRYRASWVLPISEPPIRDGWVAVEGGRIVGVGGPGRTGEPGTVDERDLGDVILMPGLVNAHTHLELSHLCGAIAPSANFVGWARQVIAARRGYQDGRDPVILDGVARGIDEAIRSGTAVVGDISNTLVTFEPLLASRLAGVLFYELLGFKASDPNDIVADASRRLEALEATDAVRTSLAAHAPYSVAPRLLRAICQASQHRPCSVHLSESMEEVRFIATGEGPWRMLLEELGVWEESWVAPGVSPVQYLEAFGCLHSRSVAVHGVQMSRADLMLLSARGATLVTCPRSNAHTGAGTPPIERFYASGVRVAVGTDSLASTPDLSVFAELAAMRALAPSVRASRLLDSATRQGAAALGFASEYGTLEAGKRPRLLAVTGPGAFTSADDVEEYLVSGIPAERLRWIES